MNYIVNLLYVSLALCIVGFVGASSDPTRVPGAPAQGNAPPEEAARQAPAGISAGVNKGGPDTGGVADVGPPVERSSGDEGVEAVPAGLLNFVGSLEREGRAEGEGDKINPDASSIKVLLARLENLRGETGRSSEEDEEGRFKMATPNGTDIQLPYQPTVNLLDRLHVVASQASKDEQALQLRMQQSPFEAFGSEVGILSSFSRERDWLASLDDINGILEEANRSLRNRAEEGGRLTGAALQPAVRGLEWLLGVVAHLELLAENDWQSLSSAARTGATPSAFRLNLSGQASRLLDNIQSFNGLLEEGGSG